MKRILLLVTGGLILLAASAAIYSAATQPIAVQAAVAERGMIREFIDELGKTRLPVTHRVTMPFAGRVEPIELAEGSRVEAGQTVARISPADVRNEVDEARAAVERLEAAIAENDDSTVEEVVYLQARQVEVSMQRTTEAAEERKKSGQERLEVAQKALQRAEQLFRDGARSEEEVDQARLEYVEAQVNYRTDVLVWQAMQALEVATGFLPRIVRDSIERKKLARAVLEQQKQEAEARLRQALLRQERAVMTSPVDGVVLQRQVVNERFLPAGELLLEIGRLEELEVEADVLSQDVVRIETGDEVEIYGPAVGRELGQGVPGVVQRIFPGGFTKISSLGVEQQRVRVIVDFAPGGLPELLDEDLGVDFRVRVRIFTRTQPNALQVPRTAIFRGADGGWQAFAIRDGRAARTPVEVGLMNDERVEIVSGLGEGQQVVLAPESNIAEGVRVRAVVRGPR